MQAAQTWLALPGHSAAACTAQLVRSTAEQAAERVSHARADASCALPLWRSRGQREAKACEGCWRLFRLLVLISKAVAPQTNGLIKVSALLACIF